jgi:hypothetical protein
MAKKELRVGATVEWLSYGKKMTGIVAEIRKGKYHSSRPILIKPDISRSFRNDKVSLKEQNLIVTGFIKTDNEFNIIIAGNNRNPWKLISKVDGKTICVQAKDGKQVQVYKKDIITVE